MGERTLVTRESIGCGSVILIALAVWFVVSQSNNDVEKELRALREEVAQLREVVEQQNRQRQAPRPPEPAATPESVPEPLEPTRDEPMIEPAPTVEN